MALVIKGLPGEVVSPFPRNLGKVLIYRNRNTELLLLLPKRSLHQLGVKRIIAHFRPHNWERPEWEYHDGARMISRILSDSPHIACTREVFDFLEMPRRYEFAIHTDTISYIVFIVEQMDKFRDVTVHEPVAAIDVGIRALELEIERKADTVLSGAIAGLLCIVWNKSWRNTMDFRNRIWDVVIMKGITMWDIYHARPDLVERMCWAGTDIRHGAMIFRTQRLKELLNLCHEELSFKHYKLIRSIANQTNDDELLKALAQINL